MEFVTVGATGVHVSPWCFGTMSFGGARRYSQGSDYAVAEQFTALAQRAGVKLATDRTETLS